MAELPKSGRSAPAIQLLQNKKIESQIFHSEFLRWAVELGKSNFCGIER